MSDRIDRDVINALIAGHFADPFSVLGMHKTTAGLEVRALLPDATDVWVIEPKTGRKLAKLECLDSRGFFSGVIPRRKNFFRYQLAVVWHGQQNLIDDPYRFGPLIQEMDAWLLSEGTHLRPYETLGAHADTMDGVTGTRFSVWAPNARRVSVVGQFNYWDGRRHPMRLRKESGIFYRDIYLWIGSQRLRSGLSNGRHISQLHTFTTEESVFGLFAPTHQPGDIYFDHISHMRRNLFRHHHVVGDDATYSIHFFDLYRCV